VISRLFVGPVGGHEGDRDGAQPQIGLAPAAGWCAWTTSSSSSFADPLAQIDRSERQREVRCARRYPGFGQADRIQALKDEVVLMNLPAATRRRCPVGPQLEKTFRVPVGVSCSRYLHVHILARSSRA